MIFAFYMVERVASRIKRKRRKYTKSYKEESGYQNPERGYPQEQPACNVRPKSSRIAYETRAKNEADVKDRIENLPLVKVERVIDGDTVVVVKEWHKIKIRLDSIDCPEDGQHWGDTATYGLIKLIGGRMVRIEEHGVDHYGRTLATIYVQHTYGEWMNVNERMVTLGHAWVMRRFYDHLPKARKEKLNHLERWARSKKVGLWKRANPTPPWRWRSKICGSTKLMS